MNGKVCVGNLPSSITRADLHEKFEEFGRVISVAIETDSGNGRGKSCGLVEMESELEAQAAISRLNMTQYDDAVISVYKLRPAKESISKA